ncbi:MAG: acyl-CoA dehydrogenase family protein [Pseudorhodoplanes sp.]|jgi:alkylation response protein AidB-like acyl-CoA dehydrogenase
MTYLTEERRLIQESAREFAMREVMPIANKLDPEKGDIPMALREKMAEMGYFGILIPEEYGGLGLGCFEYCIVAEELSKAWMSVASIMARGNGLVGMPVMTEEQRRNYLPRMVRGEFIGCVAISEPDVGSDVSAIACRARRDGDSWVINGNKYWCTFADGADFMILMARTSEPTNPKRRHEGISCFMFEKPRGGFPKGLQGHAIPKIGYFGMKTFELAFDDFRIPASSLMGEEGKGFYLITSELEKARAHTAARAIGCATGALDSAIAYAKERAQFGKPISDFQGIRFKLAKMATEIEAARQLMYFVCDCVDTGRRSDKESSMVKYLASEMAERVTSDALQVLGGAGYTTLHPVERFWRDARLTKIFEGTSEIQLRIISDRLLA